MRVTGLKGGDYLLKVNGAVCGRPTARDLAAGVNLTALPPDQQATPANPFTAQARAVLGAVAAKEGVVGAWRSLSQKAHAPGAAAELKEQLSAMTGKVEEADSKIREAARPQKLHFEVVPIPMP